MMEVETLIQEMRDCKIAHPTLTISEILRIFNIKAMLNLTKEIAAIRSRL